MHSVFLTLGLLTALRVPGPLSRRAASYVIDAKLDTQHNVVSGTQTLTWRNDANGPAGALQFHLYMNAFKNDASTFLRETVDRPPHKHWGYIDVSEVTVRRSANQPWVHATLVVPAVGDQTVASLALETPVAPGETINVAMHFQTHLPEVTARAGYHDGFYAVAQWFPKIGVFSCDPTCTFVADAHHANSEFYADFGTYDVTMDVPRALVAGATGVLQSEAVEGDRRRLVYRAEDVHDFVFTADARFASHELDVVDDPALPPVHVVLLGDPRQASHVQRHLLAVREGLLELGKRLGAFPYRQLTVVQVPPDAEEAGGMEYPTLFFTDDERLPSGIFMPELVTAHELAHQWLQGMLASDEVNEAWLDEGLTELATSWVLRRLHPPVAAVYDLYGHRSSYIDGERTRLLDEEDDPIAQPAYAFRDASAYAQLTYRKTSLLLATLSSRMGAAAFDAAMRRYADQNRFRHPRRPEFLAAFDGISPELATLLRDTLTEPGLLDYAVTTVRSAPLRSIEGWVQADGGVREVTLPEPDLEAMQHHSEITVSRHGPYLLPITVRARFADGQEIDRQLPSVAGVQRWQRLEIESKSALVEATLHPGDDTALDVRRWNDGLRISPDVAPRRRVIASIELLTALLLSWVAR